MKKPMALAALSLIFWGAVATAQVVMDTEATEADYCVDRKMHDRAITVLGEKFGSMIFPRNHFIKIKAECADETKSNEFHFYAEDKDTEITQRRLIRSKTESGTPPERGRIIIDSEETQADKCVGDKLQNRAAYDFQSNTSDSVTIPGRDVARFKRECAVQTGDKNFNFYKERGDITIARLKPQ